MVQRKTMQQDEDRILLESEQADDNSRPDLQLYFRASTSYSYLKRAIDIVVSAIVLIFLAPILLIIMLIIFLDNPHGSPLFIQNRIGMHGRTFSLVKFRTMYVNTPAYLATAELICPEKCITRIGRILRKYSLDELAQLYNVLKGDMSIVGPRPLISDEKEIHALRERYGVYQIKPGVTGLAQINGRDLVTPEEKVRLDVEYLKNFSFKQDARIILATLPKVILAEGVVEGCVQPDEQEPMHFSARSGKNIVERD